MNYQGTQVLDHPVQRVWDALFDPTVLRQSIAGCDSFERSSDTEFNSSVRVSIGPVSARFSSKVQMADVVPPFRCTLCFAGQGGVAGFGKGQAQVTLVELSEGVTRLDWSAEAQVGGKIAQLGSRLIEGTVRKMSEDFFQRFAAQLASTAPSVQDASPVLIQEAPSLRASLPYVLALLAGGAALIWLLGR